MRAHGSTDAALPGTLLIFWDYDTQWGRDRSRLRRDPGWQGIDEFTCTERLLELHAAYAVPACFAVVASAALPGVRPYHDPAQVLAIANAGHEVASHSLRHEWLPGMGPIELRANLRESRQILETCTGRPVTTFVPPYNRPFDCPERSSISLSERREAGAVRTSLGDLGRALRDTGFSFARVAYRPFWERLTKRLGRRERRRGTRLETIGGTECVRITNPRGFGAEALAVVEQVARHGGIAVAWGHPHGLKQPGSEHETLVRTFLARVSVLRSEGAIAILTPRRLQARATGD